MKTTKEVVIRKSRYKDCSILAKTMRKADKREVHLLAGLSPKQALIESFNASLLERYTLTLNGEVICMFGVGVSPHTKWSTPWLLGSEKIKTIPVTFIRESRRYMERWQHPLLLNYVHAENTLSIAWLKALGFTFLREVTGLHGKGLFYEFVRIK